MTTYKTLNKAVPVTDSNGNIIDIKVTVVTQSAPDHPITLHSTGHGDW